MVHHIVCDLWSVGVLVRDFKALYGAFRSGAPSPLPEVPLRFRDVIAEQRARYDAGSIDPELRYWRERLAGLPATSELPADRPRPPVQSYRGAGWNFTLRPEVAAPLRDLVRDRGESSISDY